MDDTLTLAELAGFSGEPPERLREWRSRSLIGGGAVDGFTHRDMERVRLIQLCLRRGISLDTIAEADRTQDIIGRYVEMLYPESKVGRKYSFAEAAEIAALDLNVARDMWANSGLSAEQGDTLREEDIEAFRTFKTYLDAGLPNNALAEGTRVFRPCRVLGSARASFLMVEGCPRQ